MCVFYVMRLKSIRRYLYWSTLFFMLSNNKQNKIDGDSLGQRTIWSPSTAVWPAVYLSLNWPILHIYIWVYSVCILLMLVYVWSLVFKGSLSRLDITFTIKPCMLFQMTPLFYYQVGFEEAYKYQGTLINASAWYWCNHPSHCYLFSIKVGEKTSTACWII